MPHTSAWPDRPPVEDEASLEAYLARIDADQDARAFCRDLARDGVALIDLGVEGRRLCDRVVAEMDRQFAARGVRRIQDGWLRAGDVRRLATSHTVERLLRIAYGRPPFAFQTLNFRQGSQQHTHSDAIHFHSAPERFMCGVWTALEDVGQDAGPLVYHPGSHKLPVMTMQGAGVNHPRPTPEDYRSTYLPALERALAAAALPVRTATPRKGEALVWAANLAHGGLPIADPASTRRSLVTHFFFKGCLYYTPMTSDVEEGRLSMRLPLNLTTGGVEWPRAGGRFAKVGAKPLAEAAYKLLLRRSRAS